MVTVRGEQDRDFSKFMVIPTEEEERDCYESFYDATSNEALTLQTCPICAREKLARDGRRTSLLSDESVVDLLTVPLGNDGIEGQTMILRDLLEIDEGDISCWMCNDCMKSLERHTMPKLSLANDLWIGDIPFELTGLTIPEQLLIARHYPRCYIFKLFPRTVDTHISLDQLHTAMAGNATLFELNTQEVVEMLRGQRMPSPVQTLASVISITFVGSKKLPKDWLKKTFRVRRQVVFDALTWLRCHNPLYSDIVIDQTRLDDIPEDDVPEELMAIVRREENDDLVEKERESYLSQGGEEEQKICEDKDDMMEDGK